MATFSNVWRRRVGTPAVLAMALVVATACGGKDEPSEEPTTTEAPASSTVETTESPSESESESAKATTEGTSTSTTSTTKKDDNGVAEVAKQFSTLAPPEFFEKLDSCTPTGLPDAFDCSSSEMGQFQFMESESVATTSTQVLTELRSSEVVEDTGRFVVGWSTVGSSAVVTVIDNDKGQIMKQLLTMDREGPREHIYKLGLAKRPEGATSPAEATTSTESDS
ncbi:hypothetical protein KBX14_06425 [Corynebacterium sp. CCUG 61414]|uniref:hypothetical protein n=1 Tax=Corynebacterium sp. CCUG 61414 TaxID=2823896 RepID=UPI00210E9760|nr:hypothetical protein [Corynebacterium sp. CCUG 61414]MCQ4610060.1 hypothetical protein [Corynebacterium sp. CCUG 61414]